MPGLTQLDPTGSFQKGRQNALSIQQQEQGIAREAAAAPVRNQLAQMGLEQKQTAIDQGEQKFTQEQAIQRATILNQTFKALKGIDPSQWAAAIQNINPTLQKFGIGPDELIADEMTPELLKQGILETQAFIGGPEKLTQQQQATLDLTNEKTAASKAKRGGPPVGTVDPVASNLNTAISNVSDELGKEAIAAFNLAGGGDKGQKALAKVLEKGPEQERRRNSPQLIAQSFPKASEAETVQLQAAMDAGKTTEAGFKAATKVRAEQRRLQKAKGFQERAVELLNNILDSGKGFFGGDLGDVLGSIEGRIDTKLFSDDEAQVISDIEEAGNILTSENLDLMSGVLSETDIKILQNLAGGALVRTRNKDRFVKDVTTLRDKLASKLVETIDDKIAKLPEGTVNNGDGTFTLPDGKIVRAKNG